MIAEAQCLYGTHLFPYHNNPGKQSARCLPGSYAYLLKASRGAADILQQSMLANVISNTAIRFSSTRDAPVGRMTNPGRYFSNNADMASLAGYLSLSVPLLAFGLVRELGSTMSSMAQYMEGLFLNEIGIKCHFEKKRIK